MDIKNTISLPLCRKSTPIKVLPECPSTYSISAFELNDDYTTGGVNTKISVIGTGNPMHKDLRNYTSENMLDEEANLDDENGWSSMIFGVLSKFAPLADFSSVKAVNKKGKVDFLATAASVLWAVTKEADVIILPPLPQKEIRSLTQAFKKAKERGSVLVCYNTNKQEVVSYHYPDVLFIKTPVKRKKVGKIKSINRNVISVCVPEGKKYTTYLNDQYVVSPISVESIASLSSIIALNLSQLRQTNKTTKAVKAVDKLLS